jgi:hypothetical protein
VTTGVNVDGKYYEVARPGSVSERLAIIARDRIYADFIRHCAPEPDSLLLDVGVSDVVTEAANLIERLYPHPERITAVGLGEAPDFRRAHPAVAYERVRPDAGLPFAAGQFSMAASNAVLEHVGSEASQRAFVAEMVRVARKAFITVPNRYFPVEHHTAIPFLHYWDGTFRLACRALGKTHWARPENLILMTPARLAALVPEGRKAIIGRTGLRLGPMSSNLFLFIA